MTQQFRVCASLEVDFLVLTPGNLQLQVIITPMDPASFLGTHTHPCAHSPIPPNDYTHG